MENQVKTLQKKEVVLKPKLLNTFKIDKFMEEAGDNEFAKSKAIDQLREHKENGTGPYSKD